MTAQSATATQRLNNSELVNRSSEEIMDQCAHMMDLIARRAFEIFESRGGSPGHEMEDWIRAEAELLHPLPLNVSESSDAYIVRAEVPGFSGKDIEISVEPCCLSITGKREIIKEEVNAKVICSECCADHIFRALDLPSDIDTSRVGTTLKDGILTVELPKARTAK